MKLMDLIGSDLSQRDIKRLIELEAIKERQLSLFAQNGNQNTTPGSEDRGVSF